MKNKNKKVNLFLFVILLTAGFFGFGKGGKAADDKILITEIMYSPPGSDSGREWIEIYNISNEVIDISHGSLGLIDEIEEHDELGKLKNTCHTFNSDLEINPKEFIVIADNESLFIQDYPDYSGKILDSVVNLLNSEDTVKISFDRCKTWETQTSYSSTWGADGNGKTLEKINLSGDGSDNSWQESYVAGGTPGEENSQKPPPVVYSHDIRINELLPNPSEDESSNEFVELYNFGHDEINLTGWKITNKNDEKTLSGIIEPKEYKAFKGIICLHNDGDEISLFDPNGELVDEVKYENDDIEDYSWSFNGKEFRWTKYLTPGEENEFEILKEYNEKVYLNEIFPNPEDEDDEFIEIYNSEDQDVDLSSWILRDGSKTGKYVIPDSTSVNTGGYLVIYKKDYKFALNNSGDESVRLIDPNEKEVSKVSYDKANEGVSYNFDRKNWRWSKDITPGKKNKFNKLPKIEVDIDDKVYIGVYADFKVKVNDPEREKVKVTWDFGDGHKSYKKETRHKYEKKGKYKLKVKIFDGSEEIIKEYKIEVKKFPHREVKIRALCSNPKGDDSENEWILVKNYSDDEINLKGWSVATGSKKLYNHPIYEDLKIKKGKTGKITREDSNFTLSNEKSKVELRYPDGKVAYELKYDKGDDNSAEEDEVYEKTDGDWRWVKAQKNIETEQQRNIETGVQINEVIAEEDFEEFLGGRSAIGNRDNRMSELVNYGVEIRLANYNVNNNPRVLGVSMKKQEGPVYQFTEVHPTEHYAVKFFRNILEAINYLINKLISRFWLKYIQNPYVVPTRICRLALHVV